MNTAKKGAWGPADLAPIVNHVLDSFGPDRVMFASDWPVCTTVATLAEWVDRPASRRPRAARGGSGESCFTTTPFACMG